MKRFVHSKFNPYGLSGCLIVLAGLILIVLIPLDWAFPSGMRATRLGVENADRAIPQLLRAVFLLMALFYVISTGWDFGAYGFVPGRAMFLLASYMLLSIPYITFETNLRLLTYFKGLPWMVAAVATYRLTLAGILPLSRLRLFAIVVIVIASAFTIPFCLAPDRRIGLNADSSLLLWCIPLVLLDRRPAWAIGFVGLAMIGVMVTVKRGAIIAMLLSGLVYCVLSLHMSSRRHKGRDIFVVMLFVGAMIGGLLWQWDNIIYRMDRDFDRGVLGSGREAYYPIIVQEWYNSNVVSIVFGKGFFSVPETLDNTFGVRRYAHSDWLEILHDMGILGIALFAYLHLRIILAVRSSLKWRDPTAPAFAMGYCAFALRNAYSQCVVGVSTTVLFGILLGCATAADERRRRLRCSQ